MSVRFARLLLYNRGDWTAGTLYPIINDDFIAEAYEIEGWPTQFHICPYKLINNTNQPNLETIDYFLHSCAEPVGEHNASIEAFTSYAGDFCHSISTTPSIKVTNQGHQTIAHATAECFINGELRSTTSWEGHVIPFDTFFLSFPEITIDEDATVLVRIDSVNGIIDDHMTNNDVSVQFTSTPSTTENRLRLELKTNSLPDGVYWEVTNSDSTVLYKGGNATVIGKEDDGGTYTGSNTVYTIWIPLPGMDAIPFRCMIRMALMQALIISLSLVHQVKCWRMTDTFRFTYANCLISNRQITQYPTMALSTKYMDCLHRFAVNRPIHFPLTCSTWAKPISRRRK